MMYPWQRFVHDAQFSEQLALQDLQGEVFTWREFGTLVDRFAESLQQQGVTPQSGVALCGKNSLAILCFYLACIQLGTRVLTLNPQFPTNKIQTLCEANQIKFLYVEESTLRQDLSLSSRAFLNYFLSKPSENISVQKNSEQNAAERFERCESNGPVRGEKSLQGFQVKSTALEVNFNRPATLTLTSGSTGLPKAVVHSVQAHLGNAIGVCELMSFDQTDSWLLSLPLYHVSGQGIIWRWLTRGAKLVLPSQDFHFSIGQATHISLVPTQLQRWLAYLRELNNATFLTRHILLGGTQIPLALTEELANLGVQSYSGYGMTEMASTIFAKKSDGKLGVGKPLLGREYRLVNGEIWLRGAGLALGIWCKGKVQSILNSEGWFATKDKGEWRTDEQGSELVILGRMDNQFISGGENIQPEEIERVLQQAKGVKQAFVLPMEDAEFGQRPVAIVEWDTDVAEWDFTSAVNFLKNFLQGRLERFKQPKIYLPLPQNLTQGAIKISRKALQDWLATQDIQN